MFSNIDKEYLKWPVRLISPVKIDRDYSKSINGPMVASVNDIHALYGEDWFLINGQGNPKKIWADKERPWYRLWYWRSILEEAEENDVPMIYGPNTVPSGGVDRECVNAPSTERILVLNDSIHKLVTSYKRKNCNTQLTVVRHALRPSIYLAPTPFKKHKYDILLYVKSNQKYNLEHLNDFKIKTIIYGQYTFEELMVAAQESRVCLTTSRSESFGLAHAEIASQGCPIIGYNNYSLHKSSFVENKNALFIERTKDEKVLFNNKTEILDAIERAMQLDWHDVRETTLDHLSYANIRKVYKEAIYAI